MRRIGWARPALLAITSIVATLSSLTPAVAAPSGAFTQAGSMTIVREGHVAAPLPDGRVLVAGGFGGPTDGCGCGSYQSSAEVFDPASETFSSSGIGAMTAVRYNPAAATLEDGRVLVAGGFVGGDLDDFHDPTKYLATAELFDPTTNTFSASGMGSMTVPRYGAAAARLPDGRVLIAGGYNAGYLATAEIFDPSTMTFSSAGVGSMSTARAHAVAVPLPDGRILIAGGHNEADDGYLASAEIFDPTTMTFSSAGIGAMTVARARAAAAPIPGGRILIAGGATHAGVQLASAETFDPTSKTFSAAGLGSMSFYRMEAAAAALPGGRVLVAGGWGPIGGGPIRSADIFALQPPPPPELISTDPPSPANQNHTPTVTGKAEPEATIRIYSSLGCAGAPLTSLTVDKSGTFRAAVQVQPVADTTLYAAATNIIGTSACSGGLTYRDIAVHCRGRAATIFGTEGPDQLTGTDGPDVIQGSGGADTVSGLGAADVICGGPGKDKLRGGSGRDTLVGEAGHDVLAGGRGLDLLIGGGGKDRCSGPRTDRRRGC